MPEDRAARVGAGLRDLFPGATQVACRLPGSADTPPLPHGRAVPFADGQGEVVVVPEPPPGELERAAAVLELGPTLAAVADARRRLEAHLADVGTFATLGVAADGIAHEFNNVLNTMMLQASVVKMQVPEKLKEPVEVIRRQGGHAATLLRPMQAFRQQRRRSMTPSDLNRMLAEVLAERPRWAGTPTQFAGDLPTVPLSPYEWSRLVRFILENAERRAGSRGWRVRTSIAPDGRARLTVEDAGGPPSPEAVGQPFDSNFGLFAAADEFERLAAQSILRQHYAALEAAATTDGAAVHIDFRTG
jgi:signal transduction histidine kinase